MAQFRRTQDIEHEIGHRGTLSLRVTSPDVRVRAVEGSVARVRATFDLSAESEHEADRAYERAALQVIASKGRLDLNEPRSNEVGIVGLGRLLGLAQRHAAAEVEVKLPAEARLALQVVSANVTIAGLRGSQRYKTVSGDVSLTDVAGEMTINSVSGDATLRSEGTVRLEAKSVSGDLNLVAPRIEALRATTVSGEVEVEGHLTAETEHRVETVSGDLRLAPLGGVTVQVRGLSTDVSVAVPHKREGSRDRRRYVIGDGAAQIEFSSMSGDVRIEHPRRLSPVGADVPPPPAPPAPPSPLSEEEQLEILRAVERGEIDVDEAARRLGGDR